MPDKPNESTHPVELAINFSRVKEAYNLSWMQQTRLVAIGCGGARQFLEDMARCGVGQFILLDPDVVEDTNIATQHVFLADIGRAKVDCIAERIVQINPAAQVLVHQKSLDDFTDVHLDWLINMPFFFPSHGEGMCLNPWITLLCGFTDNFYAQARVNRLALQFGLPTLCAGLYQSGKAAEISFTYPGVTPACQRCMLSPRYKAYLEEGYQNTVTSAGAPIFATQRVNSLKGMIALSILHHKTDHPVWGNLLTRIGNRTLVQIRMHPDAPNKAFAKVFSGADTDRLFFDEAVWLPQEADPNCPDCLGTGDLLQAKGRFADTRLLPREDKSEPGSLPQKFPKREQ